MSDYQTSKKSSTSSQSTSTSTVTRTAFLPVRSTRTPITKDDSSPPGPTGARPPGQEKPRLRVPIRTNLATGGPRPLPIKSVPIPVAVAHSHSSDSQAYLTPQDAQAHHFHSFPPQEQQPWNPRESIASSAQTEPSSYYSADSSLGNINEEDIPPMPNPHPLSKAKGPPEEAASSASSAPPSEKQHSVILSSPATSSTATILNPKPASPIIQGQQQQGLAYRTSTRTTASTSTRGTASTGLTGRSGSIGVSSVVNVEPSRQSTSDSRVYPKGPNGSIEGGGEEGIPVEGTEEDLARLVAGLEELVEEPEEEDDEGKEWMKMPEPQHYGPPAVLDKGKGRMQMPEPQHYTSHLPEDPGDSQSDDDDSDDEEGLRQPAGPRVRKISPLLIPPTPKSPPPVPSSPSSPSRQSGGGGGHFRNRSLSGPARKSTETESANLKNGGTKIEISHGRMGSSSSTATATNPNASAGMSTVMGGHGRSLSQPTRPQEIRKSDSGSSGGGGGSGQPFGSVTITSVSTSRVERPSSGSAPPHPHHPHPRGNSFSATRESSSTTTGAQRPSVRYGSVGSGHAPNKTTTSGAAASSPTSTSAVAAGGGGVSAHYPPRPPAHEREKTYPSPMETSHPRPALAPRQDSAIATAAAATNSKLSASPSQARQHPSSQMDTQYVNMLLALDDIPRLHNLLAAFFNWIYLAGFVLFPGTFTSLRTLTAESGGNANVAIGLVNAVTKLPLFIVAWICVGVGGLGMIWLWWRWRKNYIWALNRIWTPGLLNSLAGLLSTLSGIYGAQHGELSKTSKSTLIVTSASTGIFGILTAFYLFWLVGKVKRRHDKEVGRQRAGKYGEGVVDLSTRKV